MIPTYIPTFPSATNPIDGDGPLAHEEGADNNKMSIVINYINNTFWLWFPTKEKWVDITLEIRPRNLCQKDQEN